MHSELIVELLYLHEITHSGQISLYTMKLRQTSSKFEYQNLIQKLLRSPKYFSQEYGLIAETCRLWGGARQK